jgi:hypothetical protein
MFLDKPEGIPVRPDKANGYGFAPEYANGSPAGRHGVITTGIACRDQHPIFMDQAEEVIMYISGQYQIEKGFHIRGLKVQK